LQSWIKLLYMKHIFWF
jgi:hypothetical protein